MHGKRLLLISISLIMAVAMLFAMQPTYAAKADDIPAINHGVFGGAPYALEDSGAVSEYKDESLLIQSGGYVSDIEYQTMEAVLISDDDHASYMTDRGGCIYIQSVITGLHAGDIVEVKNDYFYAEAEDQVYESFWDQDPYWLEIGDYTHASSKNTVLNWLIYSEKVNDNEYRLIIGSGEYNLALDTDDLTTTIGDLFKLTRDIKVYRGETLANPTTSSRGYITSSNEDTSSWSTPIAIDSLDTGDLTLIGSLDSYVDDNWAGSSNGDIVDGHVFGQDAFDSIQAAVSGTEAGGTINIMPGTYPVAETIMLDKPLTLLGPVGDVAEVVGTGSDMFKVFVITSSDVTIKNLEITLDVTPAYPLLVSDELESSLISIPSGSGMTGIVIQDNVISVPAQTPPMSEWTARAITAGSNTVSGIVISGNTISNTRNGIVIQYNNSAVISGNSIFNTKGGIMNYTNSQVDADSRVMTNNTWTAVHNEWDIVWNTSYYVPDYQQSVLALSSANNGAYVVDRRAVDAAACAALTGNRSHVFVNTTTGTTTLHPTNGNMNMPYAKLQDGIDAVVEGGTIYVAAGTYNERLLINKEVHLMGAQYGVDPTASGVRMDPLAESVVTEAGLSTPNPDVLVEIGSGAEGTTIAGFTLIGDPTNTTADTSVIRVWADNISITENIIEGMYGVLAKGNNNMTIQKNVILANKSGVVNQPGTSNSINVLENKITLGNSPLSDAGGVYLTGCSDCIVSGNDIQGFVGGRSIYGSGNSQLEIVDNVLNGNKDGISLWGDTTFITISGNEIKNNAEEGLVIKGQDITIENNLISGNGTVGIEIAKHTLETLRVNVTNNQIYGNLSGGVTSDIAVSETVNASPNWWGSIAGPSASQIDGDIDFTPWCGDPACTFTVPDSNGVITLSGNINVPGGIIIDQPGLTFLLEDGTVIENDSPCFVINADYTTIKAASLLGATCIPTDGSNGIDVNGARKNIVIEGLDFNGENGTNGIDFDGVVTDLVINNNYFHSLAGAGLYFAAEPAGTVQIQGNLFMSNTGNGIEAGAFAIPAEYNAWGFYDGPAAGDGISAGVDADPWTHVDLVLESSGTDYANRVVQGEPITYQVKGNLANAMGADFILKFPSELSVALTSLGGLFDNEALDTSVPNELHFIGSQLSSGALNGEDLVLFTVTFDANSLGKSLVLDLDETSDIFSMAPGFGPSTNIFAAALEDVTDLEVIALPTMDILSTGDFIAGLPVEFTVDIDNAGGGDYASTGLHFSLPAGAVLEYWDGSAWIAVSSDPFGLGALAADGTLAPLFRIIFIDPGDNVVTVELFDLTPAPDTLLATASETFTTLGEFDMTGTVSMQGRTVRSGVPLKLASMVAPYYADNEIFSTGEISNNVRFAGVNGGTYRITTNQPRYLNVSAELSRIVQVFDDVVLPALELKGGNADWLDNVIDISDAGIVGAQYGTGTIADNGDVNFDDRVNIQDLALVGGNYDLTSEDAYAGWPGFTEVSGQFNMDENTGEFTADMTGAYSLHFEGQGMPAGPNLTSFSGNVTGDITGTIAGMINAQGFDILYAGITPVSGDPVHLYGTMLGDFEGWLLLGPERDPVGTVEITGPITVAVGDTIDLDVLLDGAAPDRPVLWSVYVNQSAIAEINMLTGEVTGLSEGTATVIVTVLDDSNVSFDTYSITVTP